jgi:hypothetical protein
MMKLRYVSAPVVLLAAGLAIAAGGAASASTIQASRCDRAAYAAALAAWKESGRVPLAEVNIYYQRAANDLRKAHDPAYRTAITDLTYLASLPDSGDTPAQIKKAVADYTALNSFFKTPGQS